MEASVAKDNHSNDAVLTVTQLQKQKESRQFMIAFAFFAAYLIFGTLYYTLNGDVNLSFIDSLYFLIVSFTTCG